MEDDDFAFYGSHYEENLIDLFDSANAISISEHKTFMDKWAQEQVTVPASYIDYLSLYTELERDYPELAGVREEPMLISNELLELLGVATEPFVDYVNMIRRTSFRQAINTYMKLGYLDTGMNEQGALEYTMQLDLDIPADMKQDIVRSVQAYARFQ